MAAYKAGVIFYNIILASFKCLVCHFKISHNVCYYHRYFSIQRQSAGWTTAIHLINLGYVMLKVKYTAIKSMIASLALLDSTTLSCSAHTKIWQLISPGFPVITEVRCTLLYFGHFQIHVFVTDLQQALYIHWIKQFLMCTVYICS